MGNRLIGREGAAASVQAALDHGAESFASVVVEGPAGFGKSALLEQVLAADERTVLRVGGELELVRAPLCAVATLTRRHELLESHDGPDVDTELATKTARAVGALLDLVAEQVAAAGPVALVVDDLQWVDRPSVDVLRLATGRLQAEPCTLIVAGRPAPGRDDIAALAHALGEHGAEQVVLGPLPDDAARQVVSAEARDASAADVDRCVDAAGGSPLLLRHLARSIDTHTHDGSPLAAATRRMLAGLGEMAQRVVKVAAVGGTDVDVGGVATITDMESSEVTTSLGHAADTGLLRHGDWRFDHDLIRDAVLEAMPRTELDDARRAWAVELAARDEAGVQAAADHLMAVDGAWSDREIDIVARAAGTTVVTAPDRATELYSALVEQTTASDPRHLTARTGLAEARLWSGKPASSGAGSQIDPLTRLRHELAVGRVVPATLQEAEQHVRDELTGTARDEALARVAKMGAAALHPLPHVINELEERQAELTPLAEVWLWSAKADLHQLTSDFVGIEWVGERAHTAAAKLPSDHPARVEAAIVVGRLAIQTADRVEEGLEQLTWAERRAEELGSARLQLAAYLDSGNALHMWGRLDEADARLAAGVALARDTGSRTMVQHFEWRRLKVLLDLGDFVAADQLLTKRRTAPDPLGLTTMEVGTLMLLRGDSEAAIEMLAPLATGRDVVTEVRRVSLERLAQAAFDADDDAARRAVVEGARLLGGDALPIVFGRSMSLASAEGDSELAESVLAKTVEEGAPPYIQDIGARLAGIAHRVAGDDERAVMRLEQARAFEDAARAHGPGAMVDRWLADLGRAPKRPGKDRPVSGWGALTDAEMRVVEVVADGLVYREVAERLCLSRRTVESHVAAALRKLGLKNRTQLAAAFVERRLEGVEATHAP